MASRRRRLRDTLTEWLLLCSDWVSLVDDRRPALVAPGLTDDTDDAVPEDDPDDEDPDDEDDDPDVDSDPDSSSLESSAGLVASRARLTSGVLLGGNEAGWCPSPPSPPPSPSESFASSSGPELSPPSPLPPLRLVATAQSSTRLSSRLSAPRCLSSLLARSCFSFFSSLSFFFLFALCTSF